MRVCLLVPAVLVLLAVVSCLPHIHSKPAIPCPKTSRKLAEIEHDAARDFSDRTADILNCNPFVAMRLSDKMLGLTCFVRPLRRGIGGLVRYQWHDFRVTERRLRDGSMAELTDMFSQPAGTSQRYLLAVLYKIGRDTFELVACIARHLNIAPARICYAGLKDKAGVTMQEISIDCEGQPRVLPQQVLSLNRVLTRAALGDLQWSARPLHLGEHAGNHFSLVVRHVDVEPIQVLHKSIRSLRRRGFINYFGHQRFGVGAGGSGVCGAEVGKALVMGHYRDAARALMSDSYTASPEEAAAKKVWRERGGSVQAAREVLALLPKRCSDEKTFLQVVTPETRDPRP
jgi:TruD family tRNA pseudouridine synthase